MSKHKHQKVLLVSLAIIGALLSTFAATTPAMAANGHTVCQCTNKYSDGTTKVEEGADAGVFGDKNGCFCGGTVSVLNTTVTIFTAGIVVMGTIGIIWSGMLYMSARDNEAQVSQAKGRILQTVIGIGVFVLMDALIYLFMPGGAVNKVPTVVSSTSKRVDWVQTAVTPAAKPNYTGPGANTTPGTGVPNPSKPDPNAVGGNGTINPSGNSCASYGVPTGSSYFTQWGDYASVKWKGGDCPNCTVKKSGCPMIAILNAIIKVTGCQLNPQIMANHMKAYTNNFTSRKGLFADNSYWGNLGSNIINHYADAYNVNIKSINSGRIKGALQAGHAVVAVGARGSNETNLVFSKNGHFVMFSKVSGDTITVQNPASSSFSSVSFSTATAYATGYWEVWK